MFEKQKKLQLQLDEAEKTRLVKLTNEQLILRSLQSLLVNGLYEDEKILINEIDDRIYPKQ